MRSTDKNGLDKAAGSNAKVEIKTFEPRQIGANPSATKYEQVKQQFGSLASTDRESNSHFQLHAAAKKLLGVEREELSHIEDRVQAEVQVRLAGIQARAYAEGFEKGQREGENKATEEAHAQFQPMIEQLTTTLVALDGIKQDLYNANERMLIQLIFNISKEVLLRDLKADRDYVKRLTATVIEKIGAKEAVRIRFNAQDYENVESIRDFIKAQFPELKNLQIDPSDDLELGGCKVETDLSRINASVETQLKALETSLHEA
jgi:flagellar assembly protein FliH